MPHSLELAAVVENVSPVETGTTVEPAPISTESVGRRDGTWMDHDVRLAGRTGAVLLKIVLRSLNEMPSRRDHKEWYERRVECVLANALRAHFSRESDCVAYLTGNNDYGTAPKWLCGSGLRTTVDKLVKAGLIGTAEGKWGGGYPGFGQGYAATYWIERRLRIFMLFCRVTLNSIDIPVPPASSLIRLRAGQDEGKRLIKFKPTEETRRWAADLDRYNRFAELHEISAGLDEKAEKKLLEWWNKKLAEHSRQPALIEPEYFNRHVYRSFNDGTFERGGRLYGPWYQYAPGWVRRGIWIDGCDTAELDYAGMSVRMIYHDRGIDYRDDPYEIPKLAAYGVAIKRGPRHFRNATKKLVQAMLNNEDDDLSPEMIKLDESFRPKYTRAEVRDMILAKHELISSAFGSGLGKTIQRLDSDIAFEIIVTLMEEGILCLPIHDSFIIIKEHKERLNQQMIVSYRNRLGFDPVIKAH
jgi:hypothetical protein